MTRLSKEELTEIYRRFAPFVIRLLSSGFIVPDRGKALRRIEHRFDVEDLTQEVFVSFLQQCARGSFDASRPIQPYLARIAVNRALKLGARRSREVLGETRDAPVEARDPLEVKEAARLLERLQRELTAKERSVLAAYVDEDDQTQAAVGARLGLSRDQVARAVRSIRARAVVLLHGSRSVAKNRGDAHRELALE